MQTAIKLTDVRKTINKRKILKGISFDIYKGDIFGYLGANGAGKTTTIRILLDLLSIDSGAVMIAGINNTDSAARNMIGFVLDADGLYSNLNCYENLKFYANLYERQPDKKQMDMLLDLVSLINRGDDKVGTFSKGMRQRLALARALVHDPEILILDEPMAGIDPPGQMEFRKVIQDIVKEHNKTVFFSSHNLDEVQRLCNRIALIDFGEIKLCGDLHELLAGQGQDQIEIKIAGGIKQQIVDMLKTQVFIQNVAANNDMLTIKLSEKATVNEVIGMLTGQGVQIEGISKKQSSLEEMYDRIIRQRGN